MISIFGYHPASSSYTSYVCRYHPGAQLRPITKKGFQKMGLPQMLGGSVDGKSLNLQGSPRPSAGLAGLLSVDAVAAGHLPPKRTTTEFVWILEPPKKKSIRSRKVKYYWSHELPSHVFFFWRYIPKFDPKNRSMFFFFALMNSDMLKNRSTACFCF